MGTERPSTPGPRTDGRQNVVFLSRWIHGCPWPSGWRPPGPRSSRLGSPPDPCLAPAQSWRWSCLGVSCHIPRPGPLPCAALEIVRSGCRCENEGQSGDSQCVSAPTPGVHPYCRGHPRAGLRLWATPSSRRQLLCDPELPLLFWRAVSWTTDMSWPHGQLSGLLSGIQLMAMCLHPEDDN